MKALILTLVGLPSAKRLRVRREEIQAGLTGLESTPAGNSGLGSSAIPYASPWSSGQLSQLLFADVFPDGVPANSRLAAMRVPAIKRARGLICASISRMPLRVANLDGPLPPELQPRWLYRTDVDDPRLRIEWTVDDLIFYGASCWWRVNGTDGFPLQVQRLNQGTWSITPDLKVAVNGTVVKDNDVILIPAYDEGVLALGVDALADTKALYEIVRDRLRNPVTSTELHQLSGDEMSQTEIDTMLDHWRLQRQKPGGTVGFTNQHIEAKFHGDNGDATLLIEARNAAAVDMARLIGVSAGMLDATTPKASLNYETKTGRNEEFVDLDLEQYMAPIEGRLSRDDCTPNGKHTFFDHTNTTAPAPSPSGPILQD